jgi:hypothetical protein
MDPLSIPIEPIRAPHYEIDPSLRTVTRDVPDAAAIDVPIPEVIATTEENSKDFDRESVTHVVIQQVIKPRLPE